MIQIRIIDESYGDCTTNMDVIMDRPYTIGEFITWYFRNHDDPHLLTMRGQIRRGIAMIGDDEIFVIDDGRIMKECPPEYTDMIIQSARINGGWGMYHVFITPVKEVSEDAGD